MKRIMTLNRCQINIAVYTSRLESCKSAAVRAKLKKRLIVYNQLLKRIKKRNSTIQAAVLLFEEYYQCDMKAVMSSTSRKTSMIRYLFNYKMSKDCITPIFVKMFFKLRISDLNARNSKKYAISVVKKLYMSEWNRLRSYIKLTNTIN